MIEKRCGTCNLFIFGMRSFCGWEPPAGLKLPASYNLVSMWVNDGKNCETWVEDPEAKVREARKANAQVG